MIVTLVPGFLLRPADYAPLTQHFDETKALDVWPVDDEDVKRIGAPDSGAFKAFIDEAAKKYDCLIQENPSCVLLYHSTGATIVERMARIPELVCGISCRPRHGAQHIIGWMDTMCGPHARDDTVSVSGGHYCCVTKEAMRKCQDVHRALGLPMIEEPYVDASLEIATAVLRYAGPHLGLNVRPHPRRKTRRG